MTMKELEKALPKGSESQYTDRKIKEIQVSDIGERISVSGWISAVRELSNITFIDVYSEYVVIKCIVPKGEQAPQKLTEYTRVRVEGVLKENRGKDAHPFELHVEHCEVQGPLAPSFDADFKRTSEMVRFDNGHLYIREMERVLFLKVRGKLLRIIREFYDSRAYTEITPPTLVQTQVEGGSTLFELDYFKEKAYLTQSSQFYLETVVPVCLKAYCIASSYRAEESKTIRHLSEFTHVEAEVGDIEFEGLLSHIEDFFVTVTRRFVEECTEDIRRVHPTFTPPKVPERPFKRVQYDDAIKYLMDERERKDEQVEDSFFEYGDDIPDKPERKVCTHFGKGDPIFLVKFPASLKSFYMEKCGDNKTLTNSCDLLYPEVGEVLGGSMRINDYDELMEAFKKEGLDPSPYRFYTDLRRYGPVSHGGYGIGFERLYMSLMGAAIVPKVRYACLYPRFDGRCAP